jgi:hypothetical protein
MSLVLTLLTVTTISLPIVNKMKVTVANTSVKIKDAGVTTRIHKAKE